MAIYISLLRGINVSGKKIIKMADLRAIYQALQFDNVQSYIQSGNVVFHSPNDDCQHLEQQIKQVIFQHYQFDVPVFVLTPGTLMNAKNNLPFKDVNVESEGSKILLCFLSRTPENSIDLLTPYLKSNEQLYITGNVLYLYCQDGFGKSKLTHSNIEKKLQVNATSRNLKTVDKLLTMVNSN